MQGEISLQTCGSWLLATVIVCLCEMPLQRAQCVRVCVCVVCVCESLLLTHKTSELQQNKKTE